MTPRPVYVPDFTTHPWSFRDLAIETYRLGVCAFYGWAILKIATRGAI